MVQNHKLWLFYWALLFPPLCVIPYHYEKSRMSISSEDASSDTSILINSHTKLKRSLLHYNLIRRYIFVCVKKCVRRCIPVNNIYSNICLFFDIPHKTLLSFSFIFSIVLKKTLDLSLNLLKYLILSLKHQWNSFSSFPTSHNIQVAHSHQSISFDNFFKFSFLFMFWFVVSFFMIH